MINGRPSANNERFHDPIRIDLREFIQWITLTFEPLLRREGGAGRYANKPEDSFPELYGMADMACILHTIDGLHLSGQEREEWAELFQTFQTEQNGFFREKNPTHGLIHNTAHALASMNLLSIEPRRKVRLNDEQREIAGYLEQLDWEKGVYEGSHVGAGIGAICALVPELRNPEWFDAYFQNCEKLLDPRNGMLGRNKPQSGDADQIGGTFHYAFVFAHFKRPLPYPEQRLDAILGLQQEDGFWSPTNRLWLTFDALHLLTRTAAQCPHRLEEIRSVVRRVAKLLYNEFLSPVGRDWILRTALPAHSLLAAVSAAAEAQLFLGCEEVQSERPLCLILDRRPFI